MTLNELARQLNVFCNDDSPFQRRARVLQSLWREERGFACGLHQDRPLGSRLPMPEVKESLMNFISERTREVVRSEVINLPGGSDKLYGKPRIFNDLLSSQPLCFNLFAELRFDLDLVSRVVLDLTNGRFVEVKAIEFEHSPGRGRPEYTADRSAFDVFLECVTPSGGRGFIGIEVKYHENLRDAAAKHRDRYDQIAEQMGCFMPGAADALRSAPFQQIWRDHLLAGITRIVDGYEAALFVMLYPQDNEHVRRAVEDYQFCLTDATSFAGWTLEQFVGSLKQESGARWIDDFIDRYLAFGKINQRLRGLAAAAA